MPVEQKAECSKIELGLAGGVRNPVITTCQASLWVPTFFLACSALVTFDMLLLVCCYSYSLRDVY